MSNSLDEHEAKLEVYYIPQNYEDAGGVLGGRVSTRNFIELVIVCGPIAFLEYKLLHFGWQTNICIALVTICPLAFLCFMGIGGESLSQILFAAIQYMRKRRKLTYRKFDTSKTSPAKFTLGTFVDSVSSVGLKKTVEVINAEKAKRKEEAAAAPKSKKDKGSKHKSAIPHETPASPNHAPSRRETSNSRQNAAFHLEKQHEPRHQKTPREAQNSSQNKVLNSALKEMLIRKLELGDDEDDF